MDTANLRFGNIKFTFTHDELEYILIRVLDVLAARRVDDYLDEVQEFVDFLSESVSEMSPLLEEQIDWAARQMEKDAG